MIRQSSSSSSQQQLQCNRRQQQPLPCIRRIVRVVQSKLNQCCSPQSPPLSTPSSSPLSSFYSIGLINANHKEDLKKIQTIFKNKENACHRFNTNDLVSSSSEHATQTFGIFFSFRPTNEIASYLIFSENRFDQNRIVVQTLQQNTLV